MNRPTVKILGAATTLAATATLAFVAPAGALGAGATSGTIGTNTPASQCRGADVKPIVHADAVRREATLTNLVAQVQARKDAFGLNGAQIAALQSASSAITALDAQIARPVIRPSPRCTPTRASSSSTTGCTGSGCRRPR